MITVKTEDSSTINRQESIPFAYDTDISKGLQELVELSLLYDFYSELLGDYKKEIFGEYVMNDMSLSEIAAENGISRQGVYDIIKRCSKQLKEYEEKLGLKSRFEKLQEDARKIKDTVIRLKAEENREEQISLANTIEQLTENLINRL